MKKIFKHSALLLVLLLALTSFAGTSPRPSKATNHPTTAKHKLMFLSTIDTYVDLYNANYNYTTGERDVVVAFYWDAAGTMPKYVTNQTITVWRDFYDDATNTDTFTYPTFTVSGYTATIVYDEVQEGMQNGQYVEIRYIPVSGTDYETTSNW